MTQQEFSANAVRAGVPATGFVVEMIDPAKLDHRSQLESKVRNSNSTPDKKCIHPSTVHWTREENRFI